MFPALYDAHHNLHNEDIPFWTRLSQSFPGPILEAGCGSGRILFELAKSGKTVVGIDLDYEMLSFLHKKKRQPLPSNMFVFQGDFLQFRLAARFGLIVLGCNTYSTLNAEQRSRLLKRVKTHLQPEGAFVISIPNPKLLRQLPRRAGPEVEEVFMHPIDGGLVQVSSDWRRSNDILAIDWRYNHRSPDGNTQQVTIHVDQYLISSEQILVEFHTAGFQSISLLGDYDESEYFERSSPYLIILAKKCAE